MTASIGNFVWYDLMTTDEPAARRFYSDVVGWTPLPVPDMAYTLLRAGEQQIGGMMPMPPGVLESGAQPHWSGYITVDDVDASARRLTELGGNVHMAPTDIPQVGRFAAVADPHGATFNLFKPLPSDNTPGQAMATVGHIGWHELHSGDMPAAMAFYEKLFGWHKTDAVDMGPMGQYQLFAPEAGGESVGGMMTKHAQMPGPPRWIYYFNVDDIDAGAERAKAAGGHIINGPHQVPGNLWIVQGLDPQGAMFALLSRHRAGALA